MEVLEAIRTRRSIGKVSAVEPERAQIEKIIEAGTWAPSHYRTEPWNFIVLTGDGRNGLGEAYAAVTLSAKEVQSEAERVKVLEQGKKKARRAPVVIVITMEPSKGPKVEWIEEVGACACAVQNMMLAAHALGLASMWRTGKPCYHPEMKKAFNVSEEGLVIGFLYLGYAERRDIQTVQRVNWKEKTIWRDA